MSDVNVMDRNDRASALDAFSRAGETPSSSSNVPATIFGGSSERVFGAQAVAVYRDEAKVLQKLRALAAAAGDDWYYRFPVKNKRENRTDYIEGPSIKLANDLARMYGNCEVDTRVMDLGDSWLIYARFTDYETGFALTRPFQQRKSGSKIGGDDDARRLDIAFQIGVSKAIRNVVTNALQTFADFAFEEAKSALVDKIGKRLPDYRATTAAKLSEKLDIKRVEIVVGRVSSEWLAPDIARIIAMMKAVNDGMATLDETFPPLAAEPDKNAEPSAESGRKLDEFAAGDAAKDPVAEPSLTTEGAGAAVPPTTAPASGSPDAEAPAADPDPREQLLHDLRGAAMRGAKALKFALAKLSVEQHQLITAEDRAGLEAAAKSAG